MQYPAIDEFRLFKHWSLRHGVTVAQKKLGSINFRAPEALKESFDRAFAIQKDFPSATAFFEDCMRALIQHTRNHTRIAMPLALLTPDEEETLRGGRES